MSTSMLSIKCFMNGNPDDYFYLPNKTEVGYDENDKYLGYPLTKSGLIEDGCIFVPPIYPPNYNPYDMIIDGLISHDNIPLSLVCGNSMKAAIEEDWDGYKTIIDSRAYTKENGFDVQKVEEVLAKLNVKNYGINGNDASFDLQSESRQDVEPASNSNALTSIVNDINGSGISFNLQKIILDTIQKYIDSEGTSAESVEVDAILNTLTDVIDGSDDIDQSAKDLAKSAIDYIKAREQQQGNVSTSVASMTTRIPTPPENINKPLTKGFIPDGEGNVSIDLSQVASIAEPTVNEAMRNIVNPNSPTASPFIPNQVSQYTTVGFEQNNTAVQVSPQVEDVKEPKMVQPSVKTKKDKSDLKDAAPKPTIVENKAVDASKELLDKYASLKVIDEAIGDQFIKKYETYDENRSYVKVSVYDKNDLVNPIERMGMVVDVNGYVFSNEPKLWSASEVAGKQVDFVPAIRLNKESVVRFLTDKDMLEADDYSFNDGCAELNRFFNVRSMFAFDQIAKDPSLVEPTLKKISDEFKAKKRLKDALGDGRLNMTSFKDPTHFTLETDAKVRSYVGGDTANSPENHVKFVCNGKGISISGK